MALMPTMPHISYMFMNLLDSWYSVLNMWNSWCYVTGESRNSDGSPPPEPSSKRVFRTSAALF